MKKLHKLFNLNWIENRLFTDKAIGMIYFLLIVCIIGLCGVLVRQNILLQEQNRLLEQKVEVSNSYIALPIICTVANPVVAQTDSSPMITATMNRVTETTLAVSRPLEKYLPLGTRIIWAEDGICKIDDRMNKRWKEFRIDRYSFTQSGYKEEGLVLIPLKWR